MGASFQALESGSFLVRSGPDHSSFETLDPYDFCTVATPEPDGGVHMYGAISWYDEGHPRIRDVIREATARGYTYIRWERVDPVSWNIRDVRVELQRGRAHG